MVASLKFIANRKSKIFIMFTCTQCGQDLPDFVSPRTRRNERVNFCSQCGSRISGESDKFAVQQRLIEISRAMNSTLDLDILLKEISVRACELTHAETGSTLLYDPDRDELYFKVPLGDKADILRRLTVRSEPPSIAWWVYENSIPAIVNDTVSDPRFGGAVDKVTKFSSRNILCVPIILTLSKGMQQRTLSRTIGVIEVFNKLSDPSVFTVEDQRILTILAYQAAIAVRNAKAAGDRSNFFINAIEIFITAIESTGFVPPGHCMRVARRSMGIAHELGSRFAEYEESDSGSSFSSQSATRHLYYASALHDIGILDIRCKQDALSSSGCPESHAIIGAEMVRPVSLLAKTEPIIRHHHEAWDGSGYPDGISGNDIPLGARIIALAEAYEEMELEREFIAANAGKLFCPDVVDAFLGMELMNL